MAEIQMPQLGETVTEGTITKWLKAVGDEIAEDEAIVEISTDKVDSEIPSPVSGTITEIRAQEGDTIEVGGVLAVVGDAGAAPSADDAPESAGAEEQAQTGSDEVAESEAPPERQEEVATEAEKEAEAEIDQATEPDFGSDEAPAAPSGEEPASTQAAAAPSGTEGAVLSPVVRRLIAEHGLDPGSIAGTGAGGRITRNDVLAVVESGRSTPAPGGGSAPAQPAPAQPAAASSPAAPVRSAPAVAGANDETVPFNNIRRRTGEHMVRSLATSAHVLTVMEVDLEGVEKVRSAHKAPFKAETGISLTYLPFIARALIDAIAEFPHVNASVGEAELIVHQQVNLGIAVDLDYEGLIVPVIHGAGDLRLTAIARAITEQADKARTRKLSADDISGGTVTITNAGASGTLVQMPVINQPQVMILSTEGVRRRPVVVTDAAGNEAIAIRSMANLSMVWDHRAFDGAYAAAFLRRMVDILEQRDWEAEL